jgi:hypothetical protein
MLTSGNYNQLTIQLRSRLNPDRLSLQKSFIDELSTISYSDVLTYIRFAMKGVEQEYTQQSKLAGENVKKHLSILEDKEFRFQGSVMTNTHIKAYSDIDLLTISSKFYSWDRSGSERYINEQEFRAKLGSWQLAKLEREKNNFSLYAGNLFQDLSRLRSDSESILRSNYKICDTTKPKSIKITNQDLRRDVDIVIANWYDDVRSIINDKDDNRGIQVYNKETNSQESADYPFISIKKINERGSLTSGRLKKMIRFIKNIKADSDRNIDLSSFDVNAICYDIDTTKYQNASFVELVPVIYNQLKSICTDSNHANNVVSVDEREYIFRYNSGKMENIRKVLTEVEAIYLSVRKVNQYI